MKSMGFIVAMLSLMKWFKIKHKLIKSVLYKGLC